jgi:hypothetical protein
MPQAEWNGLLRSTLVKSAIRPAPGEAVGTESSGFAPTKTARLVALSRVQKHAQ